MMKIDIVYTFLYESYCFLINSTLIQGNYININKSYIASEWKVDISHGIFSNVLDSGIEESRFKL